MTVMQPREARRGHITADMYLMRVKLKAKGMGF
jgi:hypothetical protein